MSFLSPLLTDDAHSWQLFSSPNNKVGIVQEFVYYKMALRALIDLFRIEVERTKLTMNPGKFLQRIIIGYQHFYFQLNSSAFNIVHDLAYNFE